MVAPKGFEEPQNEVYLGFYSFGQFWAIYGTYGRTRWGATYFVCSSDGD